MKILFLSLIFVLSGEFIIEDELTWMEKDLANEILEEEKICLE